METRNSSKLLICLFWCCVFSVFLGRSAGASCPEACVCKWKGGKQTVECINKGLLSVPEGMDPETQVLDISGSTLQVLHRMLFQRLGLLNLQRVYLSRCRLGHLDDHALQGLTNLVELDLSDNMLTSVPVATLTDVTALMRLSLARNPIQRVSGGSFRALRYLTTLELSNCEIELVEDAAFDGLKSLEWLKLDGNKLRTVGGSLVLPNSLHGITLHGNPWRCDCRLLELRSWLIKFNIPMTLDPKCSTPDRISGRVIKNLDTNDFACAPELSPSSMFLEVGLGKNVSLLCKVTGDPEPRVSWWRHGERLSVFPLSNFSSFDDEPLQQRHFYYSVVNGDAEEKRNELFILNVTEKDNGTFVCSAENRAGSARSNFTLLVLLPPTEAPPTPSTVEHAVTVGGVVAAIVITLVIIIVAVAVRCCCCRRATRKTRDKETSVNKAEQNPSKEAAPKVSPVHQAMRSPCRIPPNSNLPPSLVLNGSSSYSGTSDLDTVDQSPDLINDTATLKWKESTPDSTSYPIYDTVRTNAPVVRWSGVDNTPPGGAVKYIPAQGTLRTITELIPQPQYQAILPLDPVRYLDPDGYPIDYGLPKPPSRHHVHFADPVTSSGHFGNYLMDQDFLPTEQKYPDSYGHLPLTQGSDIRYPSERYPQEYGYAGSVRAYVTPYEEGLPSPPEAYKNPASPLQVDPAQGSDECAALPVDENLKSATPLPPLQVCVSSSSPGSSSRMPRNPHESPDEGYEDEGADGTEI